MDFEQQIEEMPEDALDVAKRKLGILLDEYSSPPSYPSVDVLLKQLQAELKKTK